MQRRQFLSASVLSIAGSALGAFGFAANSQATEVPALTTNITGPVTLYSEFRIIQPQQADFSNALRDYSARLQHQPGFLALTLKQMVGDSTMVKNYPESYKGVLATAYLDGAQAHTLPLFYSLFVRFDNNGQLAAADAAGQFDRHVRPYLHGMAMYRGVFQTVVAGDRHGIYHSETDLLKFLTQPVDAKTGNHLISVENHVYIADQVMTAFEQKAVPLLKVAQQTYQPTTASNGIGQPGSRDNRDYRKAMSTEILRKAAPDGDLRAYLLHGVWESVWDHENSHLDARFQHAVAPVGAMVEVGPIEPFYTTQMTVLKN